MLKVQIKEKCFYKLCKINYPLEIYTSAKSWYVWLAHVSTKKLNVRKKKKSKNVKKGIKGKGKTLLILQIHWQTFYLFRNGIAMESIPKQICSVRLQVRLCIYDLLDIAFYGLLHQALKIRNPRQNYLVNKWNFSCSTRVII